MPRRGKHDKIKLGAKIAALHKLLNENYSQLVAPILPCNDRARQAFLQTVTSRYQIRTSLIYIA